jgi:GNAT superfamily N-acetyltransferase
MSAIEVRPALTRREKNVFLTFPWRIYRNDPLWVPPVLSERAKTIDPNHGAFFKNGYAELFIAWRGREPVGTLSCAEDRSATKFNGYGECLFGFFECFEEYAFAEALLNKAIEWARAHKLVALLGPYHLDREDSRDLLVEGRDRPPVILCGHTPPYYVDFFERFGMEKFFDDGLAYSVDLVLSAPQMQRLARLAERVRAHKGITVRGANMSDVEVEIDHVHDLTNRALAHLPGFTPWPREAIEAVVRPIQELVDPDLILFAEMNGEVVGWFPGIPNLNEILIHVNGLRYPWDYLKLLWYMREKPACVSVKSVLVPPEYWDTGVAILLFDEMVKRATAKGYKWADLSITGEDNPDTYTLAKHMGAKIYKRYRLYRLRLDQKM